MLMFVCRLLKDFPPFCHLPPARPHNGNITYYHDRRRVSRTPTWLVVYRRPHWLGRQGRRQLCLTPLLKQPFWQRAIFHDNRQRRGVRDTLRGPVQQRDEPRQPKPRRTDGVETRPRSKYQRSVRFTRFPRHSGPDARCDTIGGVRPADGCGYGDSTVAR